MSLQHQDMKGILEFIIITGVVILVSICYLSLRLWMTSHKYTSIVAVLKQYGYSYISTVSSKGKGLMYRKQIDVSVINSLLIRYKFKPIELHAPYKVYDYVVLMNFPEWEEKYYHSVVTHGGLRLIHFYSMEVELNNKVYHRPYSHYISNDMDGILIEPFMRNNKEFIEAILTSELHDIISDFSHNEISHWQHKVGNM